MRAFGFILVLTVVVLVVAVAVHQRRPTTAILLTTCVDPMSKQKRKLSTQRRKSMYMEKIRLYLEHTNAMIFVVESTGYTFPIVHDRLCQFNFVSDEAYCTSSQAEADSILRAYDSGMFDGYRRILKITGKYFVPNIDEVIESLPRCVGIVYQNGSAHAWQPSEIFGFDKKYARSIFEPVYSSTDTMERCIWKVHKRLGAEACILSPLDLGGRLIPRADGKLLKTL